MREKVADRVSEQLLKKLSYYRKKGVFSHSSGGFSYHTRNGWLSRLQNCPAECSENGLDSSPKGYYDLASLTKPLVTLLSVLTLLDRGLVGWHERLDSLLERSIPPPLGTVSLEQLLSHDAGLPPHRDYWRQLINMPVESRKSWLIEQILREKTVKPGTGRPEYSDLGYMLLGMIVELKSGRELGDFWQEEISRRLGLDEELIFPVSPGTSSQSRRFFPTGWCSWNGIELDGVVHDDNCRALGGVCGHAGLFGTGTAVMTLCQEMVALYRGEVSRLPVSSASFRYSCRRIGASDWSPGFMKPSRVGSSSGSYFSRDSFGHLGFTGTSFWIDPDAELIVVLLTNRVIAGAETDGIRKLRAELHDLVALGLFGGTEASPRS